MRIQGFQKTTLLDYPGHLACTIFLGSCNFRCPFCHNASLVLHPESAETISEVEIFETLKKRQGILEGVCITGGEPTLQKDLPDFIKRIKEFGLYVKLDTNGTNPSMLASLLENKQIDYVAMDIKNSKKKYQQTIGLSEFRLDHVEESVALLLQGAVPYEFRTTVVKEYHELTDFEEIGAFISGAENYFLQCYKDSADIIQSGLTAPSKQSLQEMLHIVSPYVKQASIRGID